MRILLVADGRSPITRRWIESLNALQHRVFLVSTFPCGSLPGVEKVFILPVAFSALGGGQVNNNDTPAKKSLLRRAVSIFRPLFLTGRYWLGPLTLPQHRALFQQIIKECQPDLVHALRIPFEGMLASFTPPEIPLAVSIWGNDLTLHAKGSPLMRRWTRRTLRRANGLAADATRDIRLGAEWGFPIGCPFLVVPGSGGIDLQQLALAEDPPAEFLKDIPSDAPLVINPRGFRPGSVRNDTFFRAIPLVLQKIPNAHFLCPGMSGQPEARRAQQELGLQRNLHLLPFLPQAQLWGLYRKKPVYVSISQHDGTPNSFLEAIACGCFPVVGNIESLREWISPGENGLLVAPASPQDAAEAILRALSNPDLRASAAKKNQAIVQQRVEASGVRAKMDAFYRAILK